MNVHVFLGPSIPQAAAHALLPNATIRPPAQQGDLLASVNQGGADLIGLIDGTFHQNLSVWHNEVCHLLSRGIAIYGASSMGALRAAETDCFGMIGVGEIYRWYRDGVITGDDEVALLHGDQSAGYPSLSLPSVNIRASVAAAVANGRLASAAADDLIELARAIYYPDRDLAAVLAACRASGSTALEPDVVRHILTDGYVDLKQSDARALLVALRRVSEGIDPCPAPASFDFARSSVFDSLYNLDQKIETARGDVTLQAVAEYFALESPDFAEFRRASLDAAIVSFFAHLIGIEVTEAEMAAERRDFMASHGLESAAALAEWRVRNLFSEADLNEFLAQEASGRRMRAWVMSSGSLDRGAKSLIDELRRRGTFPLWAEAAAEQAAIVEVYGGRPEYGEIAEADPRLLALRHAAATNVRIEGDASAWAANAGFEVVSDLVDALRRSAIAHDVQARIARQVTAVAATLS